MNHVVVYDTEGDCWGFDGGTGSTGTLSMIDCTAFKWCVGTSSRSAIRFFLFNPTAIFTLTRFTAVGLTVAGGSRGIWIQSSSPNLVFTDIRISCCESGFNPEMGNCLMRPITNLYVHTCYYGIVFNGTNLANVLFQGVVYSWRNQVGLLLDITAGSIIFDCDTYLYGNIQYGAAPYLSDFSLRVQFKYLMCAGDTTHAQPIGLDLDASNWASWTILRGDFGVVSGIWVAHTNADITVNSMYWLQLRLRNVVLGSANEILNLSTYMPQMAMDAFVSEERRDGTAGLHRFRYPKGLIEIENTTVQSAPGMKMSPTLLTHTIAWQGSTQPTKMESSGGQPGRGFLVGVESGSTCTVSVYVRKSAAYTGNQPRLLVKGNSAVGINADALLATLTVGADTWEILTGTTAAVTDDGVLEFVVDCDGSAGSVFVNQWTSGTATPSGSEQFWTDGLPITHGRGVSTDFGTFPNSLGLPLYPVWGGIVSLATIGSLNCNTNGEGMQYIGRICMPGGPGTSKTISAAGSGKVHWYTASTSTFVNVGTTVRVGLQDVAATGIGDTTFDTYADLVGGGGGIANGGRNTTTMTSGSKTIAWGDSVAVVIEFIAYAGADTIRPAYNATISASAPYIATNSTGVSYLRDGQLPFVMIEFDDGTIGYFTDLSLPILETSVTFNSGSTPDEYAMIFQVPLACRVTALMASCGEFDAGETGEIILYSDPLGTPVAERTESLGVDNTGQGSAASTTAIIPLTTTYDLAANTNYAVAVRPTSAGNRQIGQIDLPNAASRAAFPFGTTIQGGSRTDQTGAFGSLSSTTMLRAGIMVGGFDLNIEETVIIGSGAGLSRSRVQRGM